MSLRPLLCFAVILTACSSGSGGGTGGGSAGGSGGSAGGSGGSGGSGGGSAGTACPEFSPSNPKHHAFGQATATPIIEADQTWLSDHVYFVFSTFEVRGCTLTLEAGTHVCLGPGSGSPPTIIVSGNGPTEGKVLANGTTAQPVVFDQDQADDHYAGLAFMSGSEARFDHVVLKNAGNGGLGIIRFGANYARAAVLRDVHFVDNYKSALSLQNPDGLSADSTVYFDSQQEASASEPLIATVTAAAKTLTPATIHINPAIPAVSRVIRFIDDTVRSDLTLSAGLGADWSVPTGNLMVRRDDTSMPIPTLTLEAGVHLRFGDGELLISDLGQRNEGNLVANGTQASPVVFTSTAATPARGDWNGLTFYAGGLGTMTLRHVRIENAGGGGGANIINCRATSNVWGALKLRPIITTMSYAGPTLEALEVVRSGGDGVAFGCVAAGCLTTDYAAQVTGSDNAGTLLRPLGCP